VTSLAVAVALAALAAPSALNRLPAAGGGAIVLSGVTQGHAILREHRTVFTGNPVKLVRGDATLTCKKLTAQQNEADEFQWATCEGDVRFVRGDRSITCEKATYDDPGAKLTCEGHPELRSGKTVMTGDKLVYDLARDEAHLDNLAGHTDSAEVDPNLKSLGSRPKGAQEPKP
jgi:lipopolysaccharide export system protein LptA